MSVILNTILSNMLGARTNSSRTTDHGALFLPSLSFVSRVQWKSVVLSSKWCLIWLCQVQGTSTIFKRIEPYEEELHRRSRMATASPYGIMTVAFCRTASIAQAEYVLYMYKCHGRDKGFRDNNVRIWRQLVIRSLSHPRRKIQWMDAPLWPQQRY